MPSRHDAPTNATPFSMKERAGVDLTAPATRNGRRPMTGEHMPFSGAAGTIRLRGLGGPARVVALQLTAAGRRGMRGRRA